MTEAFAPFRDTATEELSQLIEQYPWFAAARLELCRRGMEEGRPIFAQTAAWAGSLRMLYDMAHGLLQQPAPPQQQQEVLDEAPVQTEATPGRGRVAGGDFFSEEEYDDVRTEDDSLISEIASEIEGERVPQEATDAAVPFCTEPLAQIYAEQGYTAQAKYIYSQLSLRYPEKSAYFAALIDQLDNN